MHTEQIQAAESVDMPALLSSWGVRMSQKTPQGYLFDNPFATQKTPSFSVYRHKNDGIWLCKDFSDSDKPINAIVLTQRFLSLGFREAVQYLLDFRSMGIEVVASHRQTGQADESRIKRLEMLTDARFISFLKSYSIDLKKARLHCKQIEYVKRGRWRKGIAFPNALGGYEICFLDTFGKRYKDSVNGKSYSLPCTEYPNVIVVESFINYLVALTHLEWVATCSAIVLNSLQFTNAAIKLQSDFDQCFLLLDSDLEGQKATEHLLDAWRGSKDYRHLYNGHKDFKSMYLS